MLRTHRTAADRNERPGHPTVPTGNATGRGRSVVAGLVAAAATLGLVAGCAPGTHDEPAVEKTGATRTARGPATSQPAADTTTETTTETEQADPAATPTSPAELTQDGSGGAVAAAVHLLALVDHAYATGDTSGLLALSGPACGWCSSMVEQLGGDTVAARASAAVIHEVSRTEASALADGTFVVELTADESYVRTSEVDGVAVLDVLRTDTYVFAFAVSRPDGAWQVDGVQLR